MNMYINHMHACAVVIKRDEVKFYFHTEEMYTHQNSLVPR